MSSSGPCAPRCSRLLLRQLSAAPLSPSDHDKGWLEASFDKLIGQDPRVRHRTFQWPLAAGQNSRVAGFVAAGYQYMECVVLALEATDWQPPAATVAARPFTPADWDEWLAFELEERDPGHSEQSYLPYLQSRRQLYEAMIGDGLGQWWGSGSRSSWSPVAASSSPILWAASSWCAQGRHGAIRGCAASC